MILVRVTPLDGLLHVAQFEAPSALGILRRVAGGDGKTWKVDYEWVSG